jgi:hypothetical protein
MVEPERPQITIWRRLACWIIRLHAQVHDRAPMPTHARARTHTYTLRIYNTYCFSTATVVTRTHLNVTLHVHCVSCYYSRQLTEKKKNPIFCHSLQTLLLTPWVSIPLEKLTVAHITYKFLAFYTRITILFSAVCQLTLTWASCTFAFRHFFSPRDAF